MFNMGFTEMLVVAGLALILIGPKQLPELARNLGRVLNELKRSTSVFTEELKSQTDFDRHIRQSDEHRKIIQPENADPVHPTDTVVADDKKDSENKQS